MPIEGIHQYTKEGHRNNYFDNESQMLQFLSQFENKANEYNLAKVKEFCVSLGLDTNFPIYFLSKNDYNNAVELQTKNLGLQSGALGEVENMSRVILIYTQSLTKFYNKTKSVVG
jgi:hypothetical protein